jgi:hypothetical protein
LYIIAKFTKYSKKRFKNLLICLETYPHFSISCLGDRWFKGGEGFRKCAYCSKQEHSGDVSAMVPGGIRMGKTYAHIMAALNL